MLGTLGEKGRARVSACALVIVHQEDNRLPNDLLSAGISIKRCENSNQILCLGNWRHQWASLESRDHFQHHRTVPHSHTVPHPIHSQVHTVPTSPPLSPLRSVRVSLSHQQRHISNSQLVSLPDCCNSLPIDPLGSVFKNYFHVKIHVT